MLNNKYNFDFEYNIGDLVRSEDQEGIELSNHREKQPTVCWSLVRMTSSLISSLTPSWWRRSTTPPQILLLLGMQRLKRLCSLMALTGQKKLSHRMWPSLSIAQRRSRDH